MSANDCHLDGVIPVPAAQVSDSPLAAEAQQLLGNQARAAAIKEFPSEPYLQQLAVTERTADGSPMHPQLGCYEHLTLDAARLYPDDKLLQRAAVEEKMGPNNYSTGDQKLMDAYREFIDVPPLQKLAIQEVENKYFNQGQPLTAGEQAQLNAPRVSREEKAHVDEVVAKYMPFEQKEFPDNPRLQNLAARDLAQDAIGKSLLTKGEYAELHAAREFPRNPDLQKLASQDYLHGIDASQAALPPHEQAILKAARFQPEAERQFPGNREMQRLATKDQLSGIPGQPHLTEAESARLGAARMFPSDLEAQKLYAAKQLENQPGHQHLTSDQERRLAHAVARHDFPDDNKLQGIEVQEQLWLNNVHGVAGLSRSDYVALQQARQAKLIKIIDTL